MLTLFNSILRNRFELLINRSFSLAKSKQHQNPKSKVAVQFANGKTSDFHGIWLRDHCRCEMCFHKITKQRLLDTSSIPLDISPESSVIDNEAGMLQVIWRDGHRSTYPLSWLHKHSYSPKLFIPDIREIKLWGSVLAQQLPTTSYTEIMDGDAGLSKWLQNINDFGIGFVDGVPVSKKKTEELSRMISHIRETHYGTFWDFSADMAHGDTAYTNIALPAHNDTTYFSDPIGLQLFHLLKHTGTGGESLFVDGFNVALQLQAQSPWAFKALTELKVSSHSAGDKDTFIQPTPNRFPIIKLDPDTGHIMQIRFNNDDRSILSLGGDQVELFYAALNEWTNLIKSKKNELWVKLRPGNVVIMDNWRVLHGRGAFTGHRRMIGCYIGYDDYQSRLKTLVTNKTREI